jgi:hypothetical protein
MQTAHGPRTNEHLPAIEVDAAFPTGNGVATVSGDVIRLLPDQRDSTGKWCYWCVRVRGASGRSLRFILERPNMLAARGPAASRDGGWTWEWLGAPAEGAQEFSYRVPDGCHELRVSVGMPYAGAQLDAWLKRHAGNAALSVESLCRTRKGRDVPLLRVGRRDGGGRRMLLTCRHHANEMMASYEFEGVVDEALSASSEGTWLRENIELVALPFMDRDGVEDGDHGKNRKPRDHNRDYIDDPIHVETAALRRVAESWADGRTVAAIDLHCPSLNGPGNEAVFIAGSPYPEMWAKQQRFAALLAAANRSPIPYDPSDDMAFGTGWNKADSYNAGLTCARWAGGLPGVQLTATIEFPYAVARGVTVDQAGTRAFGTAVARALVAYLNEIR